MRDFGSISLQASQNTLCHVIFFLCLYHLMLLRDSISQTLPHSVCGFQLGPHTSSLSGSSVTLFTGFPASLVTMLCLQTTCIVMKTLLSRRVTNMAAFFVGYLVSHKLVCRYFCDVKVCLLLDGTTVQWIPLPTH